MKDEIKIRSIEQQAIDNLKEIVNSKDKIIEIEPPIEDTAQILLDCITNLQKENQRLKEENNKLINEPTAMKMSRIDSVVANIYRNHREQEDYKLRCENAQDLILNELSHLKASDEETWNKEFYDENNKLDYRKLCIELLNQVANLLDGGDKE